MFINTIDFTAHLTHRAGYPVTISRALDFAAVTDHAEYLGQAKLSDLDVPTTRQALSDILRRENRLTVTRSWWEIMSLIRDNGFKLTLEGVDADINRLAWEEIIASFASSAWASYRNNRFSFKVQTRCELVLKTKRFNVEFINPCILIHVTGSYF